MTKAEVNRRLKMITKEKEQLLEEYSNFFYNHPSVKKDKLHENRPLVLQYLSVLVDTMPMDNLDEEKVEAIQNYYDGTADNTDELIALLDILA